MEQNKDSRTPSTLFLITLSPSRLSLSLSSFCLTSRHTAVAVVVDVPFIIAVGFSQVVKCHPPPPLAVVAHRTIHAARQPGKTTTPMRDRAGSSRGALPRWQSARTHRAGSRSIKKSLTKKSLFILCYKDKQ